jgi:hypothetical protein
MTSEAAMASQTFSTGREGRRRAKRNPGAHVHTAKDAKVRAIRAQNVLD